MATLPVMVARPGWMRHLNCKYAGLTRGEVGPTPGFADAVHSASTSGAWEVEGKDVADTARSQHRHQQPIQPQGHTGTGWQAGLQ